MPCAAVANGSTQGCKAACQRGPQGGSRHCWQVELTRHHGRQVPCENVFALRTTYIYIYIYNGQAAQSLALCEANNPELGCLRVVQSLTCFVCLQQLVQPACTTDDR